MFVFSIPYRVIYKYLLKGRKKEKKKKGQKEGRNKETKEGKKEIKKLMYPINTNWHFLALIVNLQSRYNVKKKIFCPSIPKTF